jgi:hexosaminidase
MQTMTWSGKIFIGFLIAFGFASCLETEMIKDAVFISEPTVANYAIVPKPEHLSADSGFFLLNSSLVILVDDRFSSAQELNEQVKDLQNFGINKLGVEFKTATDIENNPTIFLSIIPSGFLKDEAYGIHIDSNILTIESMHPSGISRGLATLKQLALLNEFNGKYFIPNLNITDTPAFEHRGLLLDCSRHFFSKEVILKYIDLLALYKMNVLHWHLTEDQGWRLAIDKYPNLTKIGAYRTELDGSSYGGYYSKEDIKQIVSYASEKHIEIIPEIELPGHSQAAIAAYPHLSCTGKHVDVANDWGVFKDIYCAGNDSVFVFLEDVLTEVVELFPSKYIHIGGDEAPKVRWEQCDKCQKRMAANNLADEHELQSYFIKRIQTFLNSKGKQIIGWDEILEGGLADGAIVQSWRGMEGGKEAVKHGNMAIMSPTSHAYFDYDLKAIDLEKVYSFNPIPEGLNYEEEELIIGGECNIWTEHVPDENSLDSKVFPRLLAMAEVLWSGPVSGFEQKNYTEFNKRLQNQYAILEKYNVNCGEESLPMTYFLKPSKEGGYMTLYPYDSTITLHYRMKCALCDTLFKIYESTFRINHTSLLQVQPYKNNKVYGGTIEIPFDVHLAVNKNVEYETPFSDWYTAGGYEGLVDSKLGTLDFRDGSWQGFWGKDMECIIDFESEVKGISSVSANFYQYSNSWIFIPKKMSAQISEDGKNWTDWGKSISEVDLKLRGKFIHTLTINNNEEESFRYLKIKVKNVDKVPDWHEAAGSDAWIFIDEISVK